MKSRRRWPVLLSVAVALCGCTDAPPERQGTPPPTPLASAFDLKATGAIAGRVLWDGPIPEPPPFKAYANYLYPLANQFIGAKHNPHAPQVDATTRGVRHAVVYLKNVDPERSRPWDHAPPRVALRSRSLQVLGQGSEPAIVGFVRRGEEVQLVNEDVYYHLVYGRGAAFFALPFVAADRPTTRRLDKTGVVELSSGAAQFWMRGYLFVSEHPYYALTDANGRFELRNVPEGEYEVSAWLPNWQVERVERDPEVGLVSRLVFHPPATQRQTIPVKRGAVAACDFTWKASDFNPVIVID
jgi:hypothetical protein